MRTVGRPLRRAGAVAPDPGHPERQVSGAIRTRPTGQVTRALGSTALAPGSACVSGPWARWLLAGFARTPAGNVS